MSRRQPTRQNAGLFKVEQLSAWARAAEGYREAVSRGLSRRVIAEGHRGGASRSGVATILGRAQGLLRGLEELDDGWRTVG